MPITSAYVPEAVVQAEAVSCGRAKCDSSLSSESKSSEISEKSLSDSPPSSSFDFSYNPAKERKSFLLKRPSIHQLGDFSNDQRAYYSDFYDSAEQIPVAKKCENFFTRTAYSKCSSESDIFKKSALRRFSFNPEAVRHVDKQKWLSLSTFSLDDMSSYDAFQDNFTDWNTPYGMHTFALNSLGSEDNMSTSSSHIYSSSDSLSSDSADGDYEKYLKKSIHDYFKSRVDRDSTSSLCTSQSSGSAIRSFPEEIADDNFETLANNDPTQILNSPTRANWALPLYSSLLNLNSTAAEQMLVNLGFRDSSEIIPARFFPDKSKIENDMNKESSQDQGQSDLPENDSLDFLKERDECTVLKGEEVDSNNVRTVDRNLVHLADSNIEHLVQNQTDTASASLSNKTSSVDFEEINHSTVHVINNNKRVFYKQTSILDEIEEANRNSLSRTLENKSGKERSFSNTTELIESDSNQAEVQCHQWDFENDINLKKCENNPPLDKCLIENKEESQIDTKNISNSMKPNIEVSNQKPITNIPKKIDGSLEIDFLFGENDQKSSEDENKAQIDNRSKFETCLKNLDDKFLKPHLLSISCNSSPVESPLTVIDLSFQDNKESIIANNTDNMLSNINTKPSSIDLYSDDTLNSSLLDNQVDENLTHNSNFQCIQEDLTDSNHSPSFSTKDSNSSVSDENNAETKEKYSKDDENCCQETKQLNPYLTFGPDVVTIYKNSSCANKEDYSERNKSDRVYTSNFNMFIKSQPKKRVNLQNLNESKRPSSTVFSPVVIDRIRFDRMIQDNDSERELSDSEDITESKVSNNNIYNFSSPLNKINSWLHDSLAKNKENDSPESANRRNENDSRKIKVSKANIIFKSESQTLCSGRISNKVILKNIGNNNQIKSQRQSTYRDKHRRDSWTQCNFENYTKQKNFCNEDSIKLSEQNSYPQKSLVNPWYRTATSGTESKENKILLNNKSKPTRDKFQNNGSFSPGLKNFDKNVTAPDFSTSFSEMFQVNSNCYKEKAVLSLHKASQTRAWGLHPSCKNELNICANCLYHMNWHYL